jgi:two-component system, LuxR family, response regulator FixJ
MCLISSLGEPELPVSGPVVHLIDDDQDLLDSMRLLLVTEGFEVKTYASGSDFVAQAPVGGTGCIVTDVQMPGINGLDLLTHSAMQKLALPVILITARANVPLAVRAMKLGAADVIEKPFRPDALISMIRDALLRGGASAPQEEVNAEREARFALLSRRESEVLFRLVEGQSNKAIGIGLGISPRTVEVHRANVMRKTGASSFSDLIRRVFAIERTRRG